MGYWLETYAARARRDGRMNLQFAAIMAMLDDAGLPEDLRGTVDAVVAGGVVQAVAVGKALLAAGGERFSTSRDYPPEDGVLLCADARFPPGPWVLAQGTGVLWAVAEIGDVPRNWIDEVPGVGRRLRLTREVAREALARWYRTDALPAAEVFPEIAHVDRLVWATRSPSPAGALERLRRYAAVDSHAAGEADDEAPPADATDGTAAPEAAVGPTRAERPAVVRRLSEMTGFGEARAWGIELARDLRDWRSGELAWDDVDRGLLLSGPPGSGKTTFAKALALEVDADFESVTYDTFESGSGSSYICKSMRKLFDAWRKRVADTGRPVIVFWDEIDSMGARGENGHNDSYWAAVINTVLAFLDGATPREGIVMVAATNFLDRVDPALRRPGRLDRHLALPAPDVDTLAAMVARHLHGGDPTDADRSAARALRGRSPADVEIACRDARRMGRRIGRAADGRDVGDLVEAARRRRPADFDLRIALHEAGHAIAAVLLRGVDVVAVDIDEVGDVGGHVATVPDDGAVTRAAVEARLTSLLAGRAAEEYLLGDVSAGAASDLRAATALALTARHRWGLDGQMAFVADDEVVRAGTAGVEAVLAEAYDRALALVRSRSLSVRLLAARLRRERHLDGAAVELQVRRGPWDAFVRANRHADDEDVPAAA